MPAEDDRQLQRLRWQCRRGMLELDYIFEAYLDGRYARAGEEERAAFHDLLREQDPDLQKWLLLGQDPPSRYLAIIRSLRNE